MAGIALNLRQFERLLKDNGYKYDHQTGGHRIWYRDSQHITVAVSKLNPIIVQRLVKEYELEMR